MTESEAGKLGKEKGVRSWLHVGWTHKRHPLWPDAAELWGTLHLEQKAHLDQGSMHPPRLWTRCVVSILVGSLVDHIWCFNCFHVRRSWRRCMWFGFTTIKHLIQRRKSCLSTFQSHERSPQSAVIVVLPIAEDNLHSWWRRYVWKHFVSNSYQKGCHSVVGLCWWFVNGFTRSTRRRKPFEEVDGDLENENYRAYRL